MNALETLPLRVFPKVLGNKNWLSSRRVKTSLVNTLTWSEALSLAKKLETEEGQIPHVITGLKTHGLLKWYTSVTTYQKTKEPPV